jgi:hypothetical protein
MARPYQKAKTANDFKDNGATVVWGGDADTTTGLTPAVTNVPDTVVTTDPGYVTRQRVPLPQTDAEIAAGSDTSGTYKPLSAGTFAIMAAGVYVIKAGPDRVLATVSNTGIGKAANPIAKYRKYSIRSRYNIRTIIISDWSYKTGAATKTQDGSTADAVRGADGTTYTNLRLADDEASSATSPTLAVPGELAYNIGTDPVTDEYQARTHS